MNDPYCPFCKSKDVAYMSQFGKQHLVNNYYCKACKSVFEWVKWRKLRDDQIKNELAK